MKTLIVHIYTCEKSDARNLVGVIEEVGCEGKKAFTNLDDLLKIVSSKDLRKEADDDVFS